jgi:Tfp pilus assembly protein PilE
MNQKNHLASDIPMHVILLDPKKMEKQGFTFVELMIIVGLIVLLTTIAIPNILKARISANDVMAQSTLKSVSIALENYLAINSNYPTSTDDLTNITPPYLNKDYFTGQHSGYTFVAGLSTYEYAVTANPVELGRTGTTTYVITTGGVFQNN